MALHHLKVSVDCRNVNLADVGQILLMGVGKNVSAVHQITVFHLQLYAHHRYLTY